jgi:hypothetical protein
VKAILAKHRPEPLDPAAAAELRKVMEAEAGRCGMERLPEVGRDGSPG